METTDLTKLAGSVWCGKASLHFGCTHKLTVFKNTLLNYITVGEGVNAFASELPVPELTNITVTGGAFKTTLTIKLISN